MSGQPYYGWNAGRGGWGFGGPFDAAYWGGHGGYYGQGGHGGFAGSGGGGGGGGRRPFRGGDGPMGHRYEDPRHDARVQKNTGGRGRGRGRRGRGRGRGQGRGGQDATQTDGAANRLHAWASDEKDTGEQEKEAGVSSDAPMNKSGSPDASFIRDAYSADEYYKKLRQESRAVSHRVAIPDSGKFGTPTVDRRGAHSYVDRVFDSLPHGHRASCKVTGVSPEDAAATSEVIKGRFLGALVTGDPFKLIPPEERDDDEMEGAGDDRTIPDEATSEQHGQEEADPAAGRARRRGPGRRITLSTPGDRSAQANRYGTGLGLLGNYRAELERRAMLDEATREKHGQDGADDTDLEGVSRGAKRRRAS